MVTPEILGHTFQKGVCKETLLLSLDCDQVGSGQGWVDDGEYKVDELLEKAPSKQGSTLTIRGYELLQPLSILLIQST